MTAEHVTDATTPATPSPVDATDPYLWLEDVEGDEALAWVRARNAEVAATLEVPSAFGTLETSIREVLDSDAKIPEVSLVGDHLYNFWRDARHERGLWRRTTLDSYRTDSPDWETVLDLDALAAEEGQSWVWHGASVLRPTPAQLAAGEPWRHALVELSPGGSDADVTREFDLVTRQFVDPADGGFHRAEAKGSLGWVDADTVYAFTDFGPGTLTPSGYPRVVKRWTRGTPLADAVTVFEGTDEDMYISAWRTHTPGFERDFVHRAKAFYSDELYLAEHTGTPDQVLTKIDVPDSAEVGVRREWMLVELRDDWTVAGATYRAGSLLVTRFDAFLAGDRGFTVLFEPTPTTSLAGATWTRHHLVVNVLDDVKNRLHVLTPPPGETDDPGERATSGTGWVRSEVPGLPTLGTIGVRAVDPVESDDLWVVTTDYLTPTTLSLLHLGERPADAAAPEPLKSNPAFFDASGMSVVQHFATSDDGTRVPYFVVGRTDLVRADGATTPGTAPTLLYGYGGFEVSLTPGYSGALGRGWLAHGGVHVVANIRGGGEYGPAWHQAALKADRHRAYEDFAAVARDLVARGITTHEHLGMEGRSNGGLLAGNMLTQYPDLFAAVIVGVPLLDMKRYTKLLAGASWAAEYGDPDDPDQWEFIRTFSPYHLFDPDRTYPPVLFTTSTKDDRVHPGHARKLAALMLSAGKDVTYYENIEGGHGGAANNAQAAHMAAIHYRFLAERLA
ncbi:prolyl oligopeptidase family serine peptidase [Cellulosimicrobium marinum]|uniref:prolyl oligopeptidase family serine peptidase n=1 Tax=Cellulosimicrobium marinum TaxID=1638992 RepID=UPI001E2BA034|nr:prolyl oligopeptidase family serine peptidase [Cellulosimicrobium marinum]MCB7138012.1 prolyl oligopeptidase family serine peptidase [Cellulosimicrobium marinum]